MSGKKFVIDFDLDDKNYRQKLDKLMNETARMTEKASGKGGYSNLSASDNQSLRQMGMRESEARFREQYSRAEVELAKRRVASGPFSGMATAQDHKIVQQAKVFEDFHKTMEDSNKFNKLAHYEEKARHREYRTLTTHQLEIERRKLRGEATKLERSGKLDEADEKRRDISALEHVINQRKGEDPQTAAMRQFGTHYFINQAMSLMPDLLGKGGQYASHGLQTGMNIFSAARMSGMGMTGSGLAGVAMALVDPIIQAIGDANENNKSIMRMGSTVGAGDEDTRLSLHNKNYYSGGYESKFSNLAMLEKDAIEGMNSYLRSGVYGGTTTKGLLKGAYEETVIERSLGVSAELQQEYAKTGKYGDRQGAEGIYGFAKMLESKGVGNIKVGIDEKGNIGERNLTRLPEYLKRLVELNEGIYKITGDKSKSAQEANMKYMGSILGLGGIFKESDVAAETAQGISSAFANPKDALHQYKNVRAYRMATGNTGVVGMMEAFENMGDAKVINQMISNLAAERGIKGQIGKGAGYNEQAFLLDLQQMTGMKNQTKTRQLYNQWTKSGGLRDEDMGKFVDVDPTEKLATAAEKLTGFFEVEGTKIASTIQEFAKGMIDGIKSFSMSVIKFATYVDKLIDSVNSFFGYDTYYPESLTGYVMPKNSKTRTGAAKKFGGAGDTW